MTNAGRIPGRRLALLALALGVPSAAAADQAKLHGYGRHLAQECTTCHRVDGGDNGIPAITGWDVESFVETLKYYQTGERTNPVMVSVAKSLDDEQLKALAVYWASLPKARKSGK